MKATELRIGNYYYHPIALSFERMDDVDFISSFIEKFEPIPLTEEWLLKFGFEEVEYKNSVNGWVIDSKIWFEVSKFNYNHFMWSDDSRDIFTELKHVNQLQNLYHALTGNELTINETT